MIAGREVFKFEAFYHARETYESAFADAGFTQWDWTPLEVSQEGIKEMGETYFQEYLDNPPVTGLVCRT